MKNKNNNFKLKLSGFLIAIVSLILTFSNTANSQCFTDFMYSTNCNEVQFWDSSNASNPYAASWDFGDGNVAYTLNTSHTYADTGTYYVKHSVFDSSISCYDTVGRFISITCLGGTCYANVDFSSSNNNLNVSFYGTISSDISTYYWNFGDVSNVVYNSLNPQHTYSTPGTYTVTLSGWNFPDTTCFDIIQKQITVSDGGTTCDVIANFSSVDTATNLGTCFTNTSTGSIANSFWSFGDGATYFGTNNPCHTYSNPGTYLVTLHVYGTDSNCVDFTSRSVVIIGDKDEDTTFMCNLTADFSISDSAGVIFCFSNTPSMGSWDYQYWDFGDGNSASYGSNVSGICHNYLNGTYEVCLTLWNSTDSCFDRICKMLVVGDSLQKGPARVKGQLIKALGTGKTQSVASNMQVNIEDATGVLYGIIYSDANGNFEFNNLPYGDYLVTPKTIGKLTIPTSLTLDMSNTEALNIDFTVSKNLIQANKSTGIEQSLISNIDFNLYPNPVSNQAYILYSTENTGVLNIRVVNMLGQVIYNNSNISVQKGTNTITINTADLQSGFYSLILSDSNNKIAKNFVKK